jgi:hypothetical protein
MNTDQQQLYPSFRAIYGREPVAGQDYDRDGEMCQDDHDFFAGAGQYSDDVKPVQTVVYSGGNPSSLKAAVSDCWGRGYTDAVADGKDVLINRGTWRIEGCSVEEFNILCAEIESEQTREFVRVIDGAQPRSKKDKFVQFLRQGATDDGVLIQITVDDITRYIETQPALLESIEKIDANAEELSSRFFGELQELDLPGQANGAVNTAVLAHVVDELSANNWQGEDLGANIEGFDL